MKRQLNSHQLQGNFLRIVVLNFVLNETIHYNIFPWSLNMYYHFECHAFNWMVFFTSYYTLDVMACTRCATIWILHCVTNRFFWICTQNVNKHMYQDAHNCPTVDLNMTSGPLVASLTKRSCGWTVTFHQDQKKVREALSLFNFHV